MIAAHRMPAISLLGLSPLSKYISETIVAVEPTGSALKYKGAVVDMFATLWWSIISIISA